MMSVSGSASFFGTCCFEASRNNGSTNVLSAGAVCWSQMPLIQDQQTLSAPVFNHPDDVEVGCFLSGWDIILPYNWLYVVSVWGV